jgi:cholesterol oxidase
MGTIDTHQAEEKNGRTMAADFDVVVIGSGFGGAICSARLAQAGYSVLVLERGRRWRVQDYPRNHGDAWRWDEDCPEKKNGWFDFRVFPHMTVVQGAGVGGGSLVYANISVEAKPDTFAQGWPVEITFDTLAPHYARVAETMNVRKVPTNQWPERTRLLKEAAEKLGYGERFRPLDLAVTFDEDWRYDQPDPFNPTKSKPVVNAQGQEQGTCVHLGECDIGCPVRARNTLDLNYIPIAEQHGAVVKPLHIVRSIRPVADGYQVFYQEIVGDVLVSGHVTARLIVVAAGSLGSTELLLNCRADAAALPLLSDRLGHEWSSNGDFLTPAIHLGRDVVPTRGPTITAAVDLLDGKFHGQAVFIEDGGLPNVADAELRRLSEQDGADDRERALIATVRLLFTSGALKSVMPWFAQSRDAADGRLSIRKGKLFLEWNSAKSKKTIDAVVALHQQMALRTGGLPLTPLTWTTCGDLITPHPLGGCKMADSASAGVVNHKGEAFGYRNLYVADGAIVPEAIGLNPSRTIAALAEHIAAGIIAEQR